MEIVGLIRDWIGILLSIAALIAIAAGFVTIPWRVKRLEGRQEDQEVRIRSLQSSVAKLESLEEYVKLIYEMLKGKKS